MTEAAAEALAALVLSRRPGVGAATFRRLLETYGRPTVALAADEATEAQGKDRPRGRKATTAAGLDRARDYLERGGMLVHFGGAAYPESLRALGEPPPVLFLRGRASLLTTPYVAVVGARDVDTAGLDDAQRVAAACVRAGFGVVSGGARGVDAAAHEGALAAGGTTTAVLGTGIDVVYPPEHGDLFARIADHGLLVTELLPGTPPSRGFFLTRNRIIAGLAKVVVLVRGRERSGALTTARWALRLGRPVAYLETTPEDPLGGAARLLMAKGAVPWREDWI